jgi:5'-nucleotidase (lipoprotein e(P4) family)
VRDRIGSRPGLRGLRRAAASLVLAASWVAGGCASPHHDERLHSTLWVQTSAEYVISTRQVYSMALEDLDAAYRDPQWNVALEHTESSAELPPAIIVDIDETVLDNAGHAARAIIAGEGFVQEIWRAWVREAASPAVPGSIEYLRRADEMGIAIFYISNRLRDLEEPTRKNLEAVGCPIRQDIDVVLLRDERPDWGSDKFSRRVWIAKDFRVLQIVGDDLRDFVAVPEDADDTARIEIALAHRDRWGQGWYLLPNPIYGGWEQALMRGEYAEHVSPLERKFMHLETH